MISRRIAATTLSGLVLLVMLASAQSGLDSRVRSVPVEVVFFQASGRADLVTRAIDETFFVNLRATLPDSIPVRTVGPDGTSTPGITYGGTTGVRQSPPRAR